MLPPVLISVKMGCESAVESHVSFRGEIKPCKQGEEGSLAAAAFAYYGIQPSFLKGIADALHRMYCLIFAFVGIVYIVCL